MNKRPDERSGAGARRKRATLRTISELTGLSTSTVSLALRGGGQRLRPDTYKRVTEAAEKLGYVPDRAGVRLRTGKTNVITLVLERTDETIDFARYLIQGIGHAIRDTRYHLNVTPTFGEVTVDSIRYIMANKTADGVIITHTTGRDPRVRLLMDEGFPFVTHGRTGFYTPHPYNDYHSEEFVRLAVDRMAAKGRKHLLLIVGPDTTYNLHTIVTIYRKLTALHGIEGQVITLGDDPLTATARREFGRQIAHMSPRPDGIICDNELCSIFIIAGLGDEGLVPVRDIHFICKQTSDLLPSFYPQIDTIEEDVLSAGMELAQLLIRRIGGEPAETLRTLGEPKVHWRD